MLCALACHFLWCGRGIAHALVTNAASKLCVLALAWTKLGDKQGVEFAQLVQFTRTLQSPRSLRTIPQRQTCSKRFRSKQRLQTLLTLFPRSISHFPHGILMIFDAIGPRSTLGCIASHEGGCYLEMRWSGGRVLQYSWACCIRIKRKCGQCNEEMRFDATDKDSSIRDVHLEDAELSIREVHSGKSHRIAAPCVRVQYQ